MRYHVLISHAQMEARGDVGTLSHVLKQLGLHCWRDMTQNKISLDGMRQGIYDSDVFVLFLTNSFMSRWYCRAELATAIEFEKPILVVYEEEERFWPFSLERWRRGWDERTKVPGTTDFQWTGPTSHGGFRPHASCPTRLRCVIERLNLLGSEGLTAPSGLPPTTASSEIGDSNFLGRGSASENVFNLAFRRRDFEVEALAREIVFRASRHASVCWGRALPPLPPIAVPQQLHL